ncbi:fibrinogen-like protein A [Pocillopora verrucosa]|uniref:fibrinogen-like protein A n=1 Tax=Pocillopora verrucosa TaxID=203993 RepID=UPI003342AAF3
MANKDDEDEKEDRYILKKTLIYDDMFASVPGYTLVNHVIATHTVTCPIDCTWACLQDARCRSFNYANSGKTCELSDQSKATAPNDFVLRKGVTYYEPTTQIGGNGPGCASASCQNGGTCVDECWNPRMFTCECRQDYKGVFCEKHSGVRSCQQLKTLGANQNGIYKINPDGQGVINVYCDQTTDGGGWTVVQRRSRPYEQSFGRTWVEYRVGFGDLSKEFWFGNDNLHRIASSSSILRIELHRTNGQKGYAKYGGFRVANETEKYRCDMTSYEGNIGNGFYGNTDPKLNIRGMKFGTPDQDNDNHPGKCFPSGAWWANQCGEVNLNGKYGPDWGPWASYPDLNFSEMKVRHN